MPQAQEKRDLITLVTIIGLFIASLVTLKVIDTKTQIIDKAGQKLYNKIVSK